MDTPINKSSAILSRRGFLVAAPLALELGLGFIMLRKPRKLPGLTIDRKSTRLNSSHP
jgi:adenine/guanine phosphoribosyltransferase-like PRPP-binding protein